MATSNQLSPGMTISLNEKLYRVESCVKVTAKGSPFIKTKLRDLANEEIIEKSFKLNLAIKDVSVSERNLEYLYLEGRSYLFLDTDTLEQVLVSPEVIADRVNYLKEGIELKATFYGDQVFSIELPQFLELMVAKSEEREATKAPVANATKIAILETGAKVEVPPFIETGDIIKVDTRSGEYIQRV